MKTEEKDFGFIRGNLLDNLSVLDYYKRTEDMITQMDEQIDKVEPEITAIGLNPQFKNPRNEVTYLHNFKTLAVLKRQRERLKQKLVEIQDRLNTDIEASKSVTPLKPLKRFEPPSKEVLAEFTIPPYDKINEDGTRKK